MKCKCPHCGKSYERRTGGRSKGTAHPEQSRLIIYFQDRTKELFGFCPVVDSADYAAIYRVLSTYTPEETLEIMNWFLQSEKARSVGITLTICLSKHSINEYEKSKATGSRADEIRRAIGLPVGRRENPIRVGGAGIFGDILPEKVIIQRGNTDVATQDGAVPQVCSVQADGLYGAFYK